MRRGGDTRIHRLLKDWPVNQLMNTNGFSKAVLPLPLGPITAISLETRSPVSDSAIQSVSATLRLSVRSTSVRSRND